MSCLFPFLIHSLHLLYHRHRCRVVSICKASTCLCTCIFSTSAVGINHRNTLVCSTLFLLVCFELSNILQEPKCCCFSNLTFFLSSLLFRFTPLFHRFKFHASPFNEFLFKFAYLRKPNILVLWILAYLTFLRIR